MVKKGTSGPYYAGKLLKNLNVKEGIMQGTTLREVSILKKIDSHKNVIELLDIVSFSSYFIFIRIFSFIFFV
jgi:serine/threonine protein kinase